MAAPNHNNLTSILCVLFFCLHIITAFAWVEEDSQDWVNHGGDLFNTRYAYKEHKISPKSVRNLRLKWKFYVGKEITSTPTIFNGTIYFPSWNGYIYAVKAYDGSLVWKQNIQNLTGVKSPGTIPNVNSTFSRATPTIAGDDLLVVGICGPAIVIALNRTNGELVWMTQLDSHITGVITMSGTYYKGAFYVGTSSAEESLSVEQCCTFRGSFLKLDIKSGAILWQTYMLPDNHGNKGEYAGAAIWGSSPSIDPIRNLVYIATGNLYSVPLRISQCQERENNQTVPNHPDECVEPDNHSDSILALDLDSGEIKWYRQLGGYDVWFAACNNLSTPNCPPGPNPDADFGEAPMILSVYVHGSKQDIVVTVQKSGIAWALNRGNGSFVWFAEAGPSGLGGGGTWGAATDGKNVYTNIVNSDAKNFTLVPSNRIVNSGGWVAMDARDGKTLWSIVNPSNTTSISGPVSVANGVLFAGSPTSDGAIYAIDTKSAMVL
ncbi:Quinoprotein alcohol dehydrogenase-like superfamily [Sesbania bispinosa]|nr:Quinoprotein alcohol dehydrogenase-like superfamily [Sesbania bispinosa]